MFLLNVLRSFLVSDDNHQKEFKFSCNDTIGQKRDFYRLPAADSSWQQQSLNLVQRRPVKMINGETVSPPDRPILAP